MKPLKKPLHERLGESVQLLRTYTRGVVIIVRDGAVVYLIHHQMMWDIKNPKMALTLIKHFTGEQRKIVHI